MPEPDETLAAPSRPRFDSTQWSLVMQAQHCSSPEGRDALSELCRRYWYPLFAYVRFLGHDLHQAQDLTQGFFERLIDKNYVGDADPNRGKFRTFLLTSLANFLANEHDKRTAKKRGGGATHFSLEFQEAERRFEIEPTSGDCPETRFDQQWARSLLDMVVNQLHRTYLDAGKAELFDQLKQYLTPGDIESSSVIAKRLGMSESAVRVAAHRLRSQFRTMLRSEIAATVAHPGEVDDEIRELFQAFSRE